MKKSKSMKRPMKPMKSMPERGTREHNEMMRDEFDKRFEAQKRSRKP